MKVPTSKSSTTFVVICVVIYCPPLGEPTNGVKSSETTGCSANVMFHCNVGYRLVGSYTRTCQENGTWSGQQPTCECL